MDSHTDAEAGWDWGTCIWEVSSRVPLWGHKKSIRYAAPASPVGR